MSKVSIDPQAWSQQRFASLCTRLALERPTAIGIILMLWARTRAGGLDVAGRQDIEGLLPVPTEKRAETFVALLTFGYIQSLGGNDYVIEGNAEYFKRQNFARAAGRIRQAQRRAMRSGQMKPPPRPAVCKITKEDETRAAQAARHSCWQAYVKAYEKRYRMKPTRSAEVNSQVQKFVELVGQIEAPSVIQFYMQHHDLAYMHAMHPVKLALRDAERLKNQWRAGELVSAPQPLQSRPKMARQASLWQG